MNPEAANPEEAEESLWIQFTQQRLKAWQTLLSPQKIIALYVVGGIAFLGLGVVLLFMSWGVEELHQNYTDAKTDEHGVATLEFTVAKDMEPPIWVYYQLDSFHQNHRRYVKSRDDDQLQAGQPVNVVERELSVCKPAVMGDAGRPLYPCGLVARSVFNDTMAIVSQEAGAWKSLKVDSKARTIAWAADVDSKKFVNYDPEAMHATKGQPNQALLDMWLTQHFPPVACVQTDESIEKAGYKPTYVKTRQAAFAADTAKGTPARTVTVADCKDYMGKNPSCKFTNSKRQPIECSGEYKEVRVDDWGVESGHFMVWMRVAGLPNFRKLWGKIDQKLLKGTKLKVYVTNHFPVKGFHGQKGVVISTSSPIGGRNDFLGMGYLVVGVCCLIFGTWFLWKHMSSS